MLICSIAHEPYTEVVWHEDKQSQLIESIFRNFTVPQVVFAVRREVGEDGDESRICVDGKQVCLVIEDVQEEPCN